jgi:uncharacterized protein (TIGR02117 family)
MLRIAVRAAGYLLLALGSLAAIVILYLGATLIGAWVPAEGKAQAATGASDRIYLLTSLLHADIAIAADEALIERFGFVRDAEVPLDHPNLRYLVFGWGAREFYLKTRTLADIRPVPTLKGIFGDRSVMHVLAATDVSQAPGAVAIDLPPGGRERLLAFIEKSFAAPAGVPVAIEGAAYGDSDAFYEGMGSFHLFRPCNIWVADALRAAGLSTGVWTPTTFSLLMGLRLHSSGSL